MAFNVPRVLFGRAKGPGEDITPKPHLETGEIQRRTERLPKAENVLQVMPGPGEALHVLMTGRYDLMDMICALIGQRGTVDAMRCSTLSFHDKNLATMVDLIDRQAIRVLNLCCCTFFKNLNKSLWAESQKEFRKRGQRIAAARVHAKVVTLHFADGSKFAMEGSSNLRHNDCWENLCIIHGAALHDWHATWIDGLIDRHEADQESATKREEEGGLFEEAG